MEAERTHVANGRRSVTRRNDHSMKKTKKNKKNKKNKHGKREGEKLPSDFPNIV